jgi:DNA-directed RNA polymerase specialized sigma24 family protein
VRNRFHAQLLALARRTAHHDAEDAVQDALLLAIEAGRHDLTDKANMRWLAGVVRNRARMNARTSRRRSERESRWHRERAGETVRQGASVKEIISDLPPALKTLAALVLTGHNRREIAYLLDLPDTALRQRVVALKRHMITRGLAAPEELAGLHLDLAYGRIRDALLPALLRHGGVFASHDPDGHLFLVRRSQKPTPRQ